MISHSPFSFRLMILIGSFLIAAGDPADSCAATLPAHPPLRILIVSDEVNPHGLSDAELTQPGELSAAITSIGSGLNLDAAAGAVVEIATDDLDQATALLAVPIDSASAYDVLIYFAHRIPAGPSGTQDQEDFVVAVENFLIAGGGFISFHHGVYRTAGKDSIQEIIGATATGAVPWNTVDGQNVINVEPGHFITSHEIEATGTVSYSDPARGVPMGTYDFFNNLPDERYLSLEINPTAGNVTVLFASDYVENGTTHLLGLIHQRPTWAGQVVVYQPGEYQPNAVDDLDGNNFQILANAIYFAAYRNVVGVPSIGLPGLLLATLLLLATGFRETKKPCHRNRDSGRVARGLSTRGRPIARHPCQLPSVRG